MLRWMNTPEELIAESVLYVRVYFSGLIFIFIYNMGACLLYTSASDFAISDFNVCSYVPSAAVITVTSVPVSASKNEPEASVSQSVGNGCFGLDSFFALFIRRVRPQNDGGAKGKRATSCSERCTPGSGRPPCR